MFSIFILIFMLLYIGCKRKHNSPFCLSCEKGTLYYSKCTDNYFLFIKDNGDSLIIRSGKEPVERFKKDGVRVCVNFGEKDFITTADWWCLDGNHNLKGNQRIKCIRELSD